MRLHLRTEMPGGDFAERDASGPSVRLGRDPDCEVAVDAGAFPSVSRLHARIEPAGEGFALVPLSRSNRTLLNDEPIEAATPVRAGDRVRLGISGPTIVVRAIEPDEPAPEGFGATVPAEARHVALLRGSAGARRLDLGDGGGGVIGREAGAVRYHLDHPHVSRMHANLAVDDGRVVLSDLGSPNGTFVNGRRLARPVALEPGDRIDIGPFTFRHEGSALVGRSRSDNVELVARDLRRVVRDRATGGDLALLDDIGLVIRPREFVALLGPSGSGKSTLLAVLSGRNPPTAGTVAVNGADLHADFEAIKGDLAVVPQREALHDSLAVGEALRYTAELRLPPDTREAEVAASVADILEVVGLAHRRTTPIRHLSGGQVKRASLANELIARPSLLFLDEVTSGLDEQADREVMEVFRQVADGGKTVVCITHNLANVEATCHLVAILTEGGRLAFFGTPDEAKAHFAVGRLGDVYRELAARPPEEWRDRYRATPYFRRHILDRMPATGPATSGRGGPRARPARPGAGGLRQLGVLTRRYVATWRGDRPALAAIFGQGALIAILLGLVFGPLGDVANPVERSARTANLLLLLGVSCFWFGCNTAAKELVKERIIFRRERDFNLRVGSYLASKVLILGAIGVAQASLLFLVVRAWCGPPGSAAWQWLTLSALVLDGTMTGLLISSLARSEEVATALVPIAVLPQIILNGVIAPLGGVAGWLARGLVVVYWGQEGLQALLPGSGRSPLEGWRSPFGLQVAHATVLAGATLVVLDWRRGPSRG